MKPWPISRRCWRIWQRNWLVYQRTWKISFIPPLLEPLLYLFAFGVGFSGLIGSVHYAGRTLSYAAYIAPALIAVNVMNSAFFENTYASFVRMYYQKTFDAMLASPINLPEVITGEILWGATKAVIGSGLMVAVISCFGLLQQPQALLLILLAWLGGLAFGAVAMLFTALVPNIEAFNLPTFLFITPMFLFSGTFFPLTNLPPWAQHLALGLPLTHLVYLARAAGYGEMTPGAWWSIGYLVLFCLVFYPLALFRMGKRLIK